MNEIYPNLKHMQKQLLFGLYIGKCTSINKEYNTAFMLYVDDIFITSS